jgi:hypothetical protein
VVELLALSGGVGRAVCGVARGHTAGLYPSLQYALSRWRARGERIADRAQNVHGALQRRRICVEAADHRPAAKLAAPLRSAPPPAAAGSAVAAEVHCPCGPSDAPCQV